MNQKYIATGILIISTMVSGITCNPYEAFATELLAQNDINETNTTATSKEETLESSSNNNLNEIHTTDSLTDCESSLNNHYQFHNRYRLYINPSVQYHNAYYGNLGTEGRHMNDIAHYLDNLLKEQTNLIVKCNYDHNDEQKALSLSQSVADSNAFNADFHLALHSNAGGGSGSEIWTSSKDESKSFAKSVLEAVNQLLPFPSRGSKDCKNTLYEIKNTKATSILLEVLFHDDKSQAEFIITHKREIAQKLFEGIIKYLSSIDN